MRVALAGLLALLAACAPRPPAHPGHAQLPDAHRLPLGPPALRGQELTLRAGELAAAASGRRIGLVELRAQLHAKRLVIVGESHSHREHHAIQQRVVESMLATGEPLLLGMEMFQPTQQPVLDRWVAGELDEREFVRGVGWYEGWGFSYRYYRGLLRLARARRVQVVALNAPSSIVRRVGRGGLASLTAAERAQLPAGLWLGADDHRRLFAALLGLPRWHASTGPHRGPHAGALEHLYQAQVAWDETMAARALAALDARPGARMVILAGSGHALYGLGIDLRLARRRPELARSTLVCLSTGARDRSVTFARGVADFVWATAPEGRATSYPALGVVLARGGGPGDGARVERLAPGARPPRGLELRVGDVIVEADGRRIGDAFALRWLLEEKEWGDAIALRVRRGASLLELRGRL